MIRFILMLLFQVFFAGAALAQNGDTLPGQQDSVAGRQIDTIAQHPKKLRPVRLNDSLPSVKSDSASRDSTELKVLQDSAWLRIAMAFPGNDFIKQAVQHNVFFALSASAITIRSDKKEFKGKELLFYTVIALLLFFAFIRFSFPKYLGDLFRVAFRTTLKQRQIGEQLIQAPLPSLLLNFFFLVTTSFYLDFVLQHFHLSADYNFWLLYFYCFLALTVIYVLKFLSLKFFGWLFNITATTDAYIFIVFMLNKVIGIYILPFLVLLSFTENDIYQVAFVLSYIGIFAILAYRFILSYGLVRSQIRLNPFHFFVYLCAFEIVPLLLIYKALLLWF